MALGFTVVRSPSPGSVSENPRVVTADGAVGAGVDLLAICVSTGTGTFTSFADSAGNVYVRDASQGGSGSRFAIFRSFAVANAIVSGATTFTLTTSGNSVKGIFVVAVTGGHIGGPDKTNALGSQTTATPTTGASGVLTNAVELAFASYCWDSADTFAETASWTNLLGAAGTKMTTSTAVASTSAQYLLTAATTSLNPAPTLGASVTDAGGIAVYTWAPSGAAPTADQATIHEMGQLMPNTMTAVQRGAFFMRDWKRRASGLLVPTGA